MPNYEVTVTKELSGKTSIVIMATSEEEIRKNAAAITNHVEIYYSGDDWEYEEMWSPSLEAVKVLKNPKDAPDYFLIKGNISTDEKAYIEWQKEFKDKKISAPLPGQLGIPGVAKDIPK